MKKFIYLVMTIATLVLLVGCNSSNTGNSNDNQSNSTSSNTNEPATEVETPEEEPSTNGQSSENPTNTGSGTVVDENTLSYSSKGQETKATTTIAESDNQSFTIALLPEFTLSAEEPGKDVVLYNANDQVFMRVETVPLADSTYENMLQATEEFMKAGSSNGETSSDEEAVKLAPSSAKNVAAFYNDYGTDSTVALLFETDSLYVRLTVFDTKEVDLTEAMLKMGATIQPK